MSKALHLLNIYFILLISYAFYTTNIYAQDNKISEFKPDLYIINIGVSNYKNYPEAKLKYAAKDAHDLDSVIKTSKVFRQVHSFLLQDELAYRDTILSLKKELLKSSVDDYVLLSFSGHGILDDNLDFYACTYNINLKDIRSTAVNFDELENLLDSIPSRQKIFLIDACYSGEVDKEEVKEMIRSVENNDKGKGIHISDAKPFKPGNEIKVYKQSTFDLMNELFVDLRRRTGATVISSSSGVDVSYEKDQWKNGLFTYAVLSALRKNSDADINPRDGKIYISELVSYVIKTVTTLSEGLQVPTTREENIEFDYRVW